jgi:hypothetical protein
LLEGVNAHVEDRRIVGAGYQNDIPTLDAFCRYAGDIPLRSIWEAK